MTYTRKRILVVDGHQDNLQVMLNDLFEGGYQNIFCATSIRDAADIALKESPDLILQDLDADDGGIELWNLLKDQKKAIHIPVLFIYGVSPEWADIDWNLFPKARDFIKKPYDKAELIAKINCSLSFSDIFLHIERQKEELLGRNRDLEISRHRLQMIATASQEALVFLQDGVINEVNERYLEMTGFQMNMLIGHSLLSLVPKEERGILVSLESEESCCADISLNTADGGFLPCVARINPFSFGEQHFLVLSIRQLSECGKDKCGNPLARLEELAMLRNTAEEQIREMATINLREFQVNEFLKRLSGKLVQLKGARDFASSSSAKVLQQLISDIQVLQNEKLWDEFRSRFILVHPGFYTRLLREFPGLTENDLRIMALIRLNLSTKEMSEMIIQPVNTIKAIRKRIRQKLMLTHKEESLHSFLARY